MKKRILAAVISVTAAASLTIGVVANATGAVSGLSGAEPGATDSSTPIPVESEDSVDSEDSNTSGDSEDSNTSGDSEDSNTSGDSEDSNTSSDNESSDTSSNPTTIVPGGGDDVVNNGTGATDDTTTSSDDTTSSDTTSSDTTSTDTTSSDVTNSDSSSADTSDVTSSDTTDSDSSSDVTSNGTSSDNGGASGSDTSNGETAAEAEVVTGTFDATKDVDYVDDKTGFGIAAAAGTFASDVTSVTFEAKITSASNVGAAQRNIFERLATKFVSALTRALGGAAEVTVNGSLEVSLRDQNGNPIEPVNGLVEVSFQHDGKSTHLAYDGANGVEFYRISNFGKTGKAKVGHFSTYYFVTLDEKTAANVNEGEAYVAPADTNNGGTIGGNTTGTGTNPATGVAVAAIPAIAGAAVVAFCIAKKRK